MHLLLWIKWREKIRLIDGSGFEWFSKIAQFQFRGKKIRDVRKHLENIVEKHKIFTKVMTMKRQMAINKPLADKKLTKEARKELR